MSEAMIVNSATLFRVVLLGGLLLVLPFLSRKGLLFGAYVGERVAGGEVARSMLRRWKLECSLLMAVSLAVGFGISLSGRPLAGNYTATVILVLGGLALYLRTYYQARRLIPPTAARQAETAAAPTLDVKPNGAGFAALVLGVCIIAGLATVLYGLANYDAMAERMDDGTGWHEEAGGSIPGPVVVAILVPMLNLVVCTFFALLALLTAGAKLSIRSGSGGGSTEAQLSFRGAMTHLFSWTALFFCVFMTWLSVQLIRVELGEIPSVGAGIIWLSGALVVFSLSSLIWVLKRYGQGGALAEKGSVEAPLTDGLADNRHWFWGAFYVNREDPSILVEKRFGFGYTFNYGNWKAVAMVAFFSLLTLGLTALILIGMAS